MVFLFQPIFKPFAIFQVLLRHHISIKGENLPSFRPQNVKNPLPPCHNVFVCFFKKLVESVEILTIYSIGQHRLPVSL